MAMQADHALGRLLVHGIDHEHVPDEQQRILGVHQVRLHGSTPRAVHERCRMRCLLGGDESRWVASADG